MNWVTIGLVALAIFLVVRIAQRELFDARMIAPTDRLTPFDFDAPVQPVLRSSNTSGSWLAGEQGYSRGFEENYHLDWLPESVVKRQ